MSKQWLRFCSSLIWTQRKLCQQSKEINQNTKTYSTLVYEIQEEQQIVRHSDFSGSKGNFYYTVILVTIWLYIEKCLLSTTDSFCLTYRVLSECKFSLYYDMKLIDLVFNFIEPF